VFVLSVIPGGHDITPVAGSARRVRDGLPADLTSPLDYPAEAVCLVCGQAVRIERWFTGTWVHLGHFSNPEDGKEA
jgi:hypothetical protein